MRFQRGVALTFVACLALGACKLPFGGQKAPTGQVVATVDGKEITSRELQAELRGLRVTDPALRKEAEGAAIRNIVVRKLLVDAARKQGIDRTPEFVLQRERVIEALLVQSLENKIAAAVPAPTRDEAERFVTDHPNIFSERKVWLVDQIRIVRPSNPRTLDQLKPLNTMDEIIAWLTTQKIEYRRGNAGLDAVGADPTVVEKIVNLPPSEVFIIPEGNLVTINQIKEVKTVPFTGEPAVNYALNLLRTQRTGVAVRRQLEAIVAKGSGKVRYGEAYTPSKPKPTTARPTGAANGA